MTVHYCEDYEDPNDREYREGQTLVRDEEEDNEFGCCYPDKCLMPAFHFRDECHTVEDMEAYYAEQEQVT